MGVRKIWGAVPLPCESVLQVKIAAGDPHSSRSGDPGPPRPRTRRAPLSLRGLSGGRVVPPNATLSSAKPFPTPQLEGPPPAGWWGAIAAHRHACLCEPKAVCDASLSCVSLCCVPDSIKVNLIDTRIGTLS